MDYKIASITAPDTETARRIARKLLEKRLCACVHIVPGIESQYWWNGKIEVSNEVWLVIKTLKNKLDQIEQVLKEEHPYQTPEFVAYDITEGSEPYLQWLAQSVD